jgi:hypothetical protein
VRGCISGFLADFWRFSMSYTFLAVRTGATTVNGLNLILPVRPKRIRSLVALSAAGCLRQAATNSLGSIGVQEDK